MKKTKPEAPRRRRGRPLRKGKCHGKNTGKPCQARSRRKGRRNAAGTENDHLRVRREVRPPPERTRRAFPHRTARRRDRRVHGMVPLLLHHAAVQPASLCGLCRGGRERAHLCLRVHRPARQDPPLRLLHHQRECGARRQGKAPQQARAALHRRKDGGVQQQRRGRGLVRR